MMTSRENDLLCVFSYSSNIKHGVRQVDNVHGSESSGQCSAEHFSKDLLESISRSTPLNYLN